MNPPKRMRLTLTRESTRDASCTLGILIVGDKEFCTIERPWVPTTLSAGGTKGLY